MWSVVVLVHTGLPGDVSATHPSPAQLDGGVHAYGIRPGSCTVIQTRRCVTSRMKWVTVSRVARRNEEIRRFLDVSSRSFGDGVGWTSQLLVYSNTSDHSDSVTSAVTTIPSFVQHCHYSIRLVSSQAAS